MMETILEKAVRLAVPLLSADEADQQILILLRQVGQLEQDLASHVEARKAWRRLIGNLERENEALKGEIRALTGEEHRLQTCATKGAQDG
jgi:hypothetical protein